MLLSRGIEYFWETQAYYHLKLGQAQSGNFDSFPCNNRPVVRAQSQQGWLGRAGPNLHVGVCCLVGLIASVSDKGTQFIHEQSLTQKENWIWIAALVTNEVDVERIPKSREARRGSPQSHIHTPASLQLTEWGNSISIGYRPVNLIPLSQVPPSHHSAFQLGIVMPRVSKAICVMYIPDSAAHLPGNLTRKINA